MAGETPSYRIGRCERFAALLDNDLGRPVFVRALELHEVDAAGQGYEKQVVQHHELRPDLEVSESPAEALEGFRGRRNRGQAQRTRAWVREMSAVCLMIIVRQELFLLLRNFYCSVAAIHNRLLNSFDLIPKHKSQFLIFFRCKIR